MPLDRRPRLAVQHFAPTSVGPARKSPVVLLHSGGMSGRQWRKFAAELSESREVYVPDFLGYGESGPWPAGERFHASLEVLALERLLDELEAPPPSGPRGPVHLVGHSYGGAIAFLAAFHRRNIASIVAYEPPLFGILDEPPARPVAAVDDLEGWLRGFVDYWNVPGAWEAMPETGRASFRANGMKLFDEVQCLLGDRTPAATYATLSIPALLLGGEHSPIAARTLTDRIAAAMPEGRAVRIPGAGHMGPITHAPTVHQQITAFLDEVDETLKSRQAP